MTEHQVGGQVVGQLVHGGGRKPIPCVQASDEAGREYHRAIVMNVGISEVSCDGVPSVVRLNPPEVERNFIKSFVPADSFPTTRSAPHRILQPVLVVVKILQGNSLRADVTSAERIILVPAYV
jgi:hypothetical protein